MRRLILGLIAALALAPAAHADELNDLIVRYVAWRGGEAYARLSSIHLTGHVETAGLKGTIEAWSTRDGRSRDAADLGVIKSASGVDPRGGWETTQSGQVIDASQAALLDARRRIALDFDDAIHGHGGAHVSLLGSEQRDGRAFQVMRVTFDDADTFDLFLDPATGALYGERLMQNRREKFDRFDDWRVVDGVRMPFLTVETSSLPGGGQTLRVDSIELNRPIDPAVFMRPEGVRKAAFARGGHTTGWLPFEFFEDSRIYIPAQVNGHAVQVLLDSGAETTVLDKGWAASVGLKAQGQVTAIGSGGADTAGLLPGVTIALGDLTLPDLTVATIDIAAVGERIGHPLPVVLGNEVFNQLVVDIDFQGRRIAFHDPEGFTPPSGAVAVPIKLADGIRSVPVSVEGRAPEAFDFDLGNGSPLLVFPAYWGPQKLLEGRASSKALGGAVGGVHPEAVATLRKVEFAGVAFAEVPTIFTPEGLSGVDTSRTLGNIGLPILSRFRLIADYPHDRLWLIPNAEAVRAPFAKDRLGLSLTHAGKVFAVEFVSPGSPADGAGLKAGDHIALIDRKPPETLNPAAIRSLKTRPAGTLLELTMEDGSVKRVRMADYF